MGRSCRHREADGRRATAVRMGRLIVTALQAPLQVLLWMLALPLTIGRFCIATGEWVLRAFVACVLGLFGMLLLTHLIFGLAIHCFIRGYADRALL
jgi:hypothetical protein